MRINIPRIPKRMPSPRIWLGIALIGVSICGTVWVVSENSTGTGMVLAARFIPAGTVISGDDLAQVRVQAEIDVSPIELSEVIGRRTAVDLAAGDLVSQHTLDSTASSRRAIAVPLDVAPASTIAAGSRIELWFVDAENSRPPRLAAHDVVVIAVRRGGFGDGDLVDVSIDVRDEGSLLAALGANGQVIATQGVDSM